MTAQELQKAVDQLKAEGHNEEEILGAFYKMFQDDKLTLDELEGIVNIMGYHFSDEFKNMSPEDQKTKGYEEVDDESDVEQDLGEGKELVDDGKEVKSTDDKSDNKPDNKPNNKTDEDDEEAEAMKLFGQK